MGDTLLRLIADLARLQVLGRFPTFSPLVVVYFSLPPFHLFFGFLHALKLFLPFSELPLTLLSHKPPILIHHGQRQGEGPLRAINCTSTKRKPQKPLFAGSGDNSQNQIKVFLLLEII
jgi:hypothetical protein